MLSDAQSWLVVVPCLAGPADPTSALAAALGLPHRAHAQCYRLTVLFTPLSSFSPEAATGGR